MRLLGPETKLQQVITWFIFKNDLDANLKR